MRFIVKPLTITFLGACISILASQALAQQKIVTMKNLSVASDVKTHFIVPMPTTHSFGQSIPSKGLGSRLSAAARAHSGLPHGPRYPADLQYQGGAVVPRAVHHSIFVNTTSTCAPNTCWGNPIGFLTDLGRSEMIHITDQYVGSHSSHRYTVGTNYAVNWSPVFGGTAFTDLDVALIAYGVASATNGFGFGDIYHVFLVPGQDLCFDDTYSVCYSPDNFPTYYFCAYHSGAEDSAGNQVLYTAEPFQNVVGCSVRPDAPNGQLTDSTNNVLSHETFETITDPWNGTGWLNLADNGLFGEEIGDECSFLYFTTTDVFFNPSFVRLNGNPYLIQPEYVNSQHTCNTSVDD
jgi:hypothetical protein